MNDPRVAQRLIVWQQFFAEGRLVDPAELCADHPELVEPLRQAIHEILVIRNNAKPASKLHDGLEAADTVPKDWKVSPWTADWYSRADWEKKIGPNFFENGVFHRRYGGDLKGVIHAIDLKTGAPSWKLDFGTDKSVQAPGMIYGGPIVHGGRVFAATCNLQGPFAGKETVVVCIGGK